jgi:hypothetical protein
MTVKAIRQVRTLRGAGQLEDEDGHSTSVSYILLEREEMLEGTIRAGRLPSARQGVLHLEDGLKIKVILKASDGHVAQVESTGPPF